jgi:3-keto-5-aminohexanoate cleavage enzyme
MTYQDYLDGKPVIITAALTGGVQGKETVPALPETPEEIAEAAAGAEAAGASILHLHARKPNGERAFAAERFEEIDAAVREATDDVIIQHSTGGTGANDEVRAQPLETDPAPEMASLDMGPMNRYAKITSENTRTLVDRLHDRMRERGIKPELEVFNGGHLNESLRIWDDLVGPPYVNLIFGGGTTTIPHPRNLMSMLQNVPDDAEFNVIGFGPHQLPMTTTSLLLGGHVRVGLEDNAYYRAGERAESNAQLVERAARVADELGRPVASTAEAREILDIG